MTTHQSSTQAMSFEQSHEDKNSVFVFGKFHSFFFLLDLYRIFFLFPRIKNNNNNTHHDGILQI